MPLTAIFPLLCSLGEPWLLPCNPEAGISTDHSALWRNILKYTTLVVLGLMTVCPRFSVFWGVEIVDPSSTLTLE